jgi:hypothetical protein
MRELDLITKLFIVGASISTLVMALLIVAALYVYR